MIRHEFTDHVDIDPARVHGPDGTHPDPVKAAAEFVLTASGTQKAAAVAAAVEGPLTASCPASVLQLHPHATVVVDEAAAALLRDAAFYREVYTHKPAHQQH